MINTTSLTRRVGAAIVFSGCLLGAVSCSSKKDEPAKPAMSAEKTGRSVTVVEGEAGGVVEDTYTASATVRAIDAKSRKITLEGKDGRKVDYTVPAEARNFEQIKVGDKVSATIAQRLTVKVTEAGTPGEAHTAALTRSPKGAKPGGMYAESFESVATVDSIDTPNRTATLKFADGDTYTLPVRSDVDLSKYKVGDRVVMRVTERLSVLVESP